MKHLALAGAVAALLAPPALGSPLLVVHPKSHRLVDVERSQRANLAHVRYVCRRGAGANRRRNCAAAGWLRRELAETERALHPRPSIPGWLLDAFSCIHRHEGAWNANTGNGYHGGLQMDASFESTYGAAYVARWGHAENWPVWAQLDAAARAYSSGRGFGPWPNTARACGLL